ncbi:hypothetical protein BH23CHL2_BH23CHL2_19660 [soil metagenome]
MRYVMSYTAPTMTFDIFDYLHQSEDRLGAEQPEGFGMTAVALLMRSNAFQQHDAVELKRLARGLRQINLDTMRLARAYPDVFHPDIMRSREAENRIYDAVLKDAQTI